MTVVWAQWGHVLTAAALALPLVLVVIAVRSRRDLGGGRRLGWVAALAEVGALAGPMPWLWMILTPQPGDRRVRPIPLSELPGYLGADRTTALVQVVGNLAVFLAFGAGAPVRWPMRLRTVALAAGAGAATVEVLQYLLDLGRVASVDDVLLNTAGAVLGALATRPWWRTAAG